MTATAPPQPRPFSSWLLVAAVIVIGAVVSVVFYTTQATALPEHVTSDEYAAAEERFRELYGKRPDRIDVLSLIAELAVHSDRLDTAIACFAEIPTDHPQYGASARLQEGQVFLRLNRARAAEHSFREFLALAETNPDISPQLQITARKLLAFIYSVELRFEERKQLLAQDHAQGAVNVFDSKQYYLPNLLIWNSATGRTRLNQFLEQDPEDTQLQIALGRYLVGAGKLDEAQSLLEKLHQEFPENLHCSAALLECYLEADRLEDLTHLAQSLPDDTPEEPWLLTRMRAESALVDENWDNALRQFERLLQADPANSAAHAGLAQAYRALGRDADRDQALEKTQLLADIRVNLSTVNEEDPTAALKLAQACDKIPFPEAANAFRQHARRIQQRISQQPIPTQFPQ